MCVTDATLIRSFALIHRNLEDRLGALVGEGVLSWPAGCDQGLLPSACGFPSSFAPLLCAWCVLVLCLSLCCALSLSPSGSHWWAWSLELRSAHLQLINRNQHTLIYPDQPSRPRRIVESVTVRKRQLHLNLFLCFLKPLLTCSLSRHRQPNLSLNHANLPALPTLNPEPEPESHHHSQRLTLTCHANHNLLLCFQ